MIPTNIGRLTHNLSQVNRIPPGRIRRLLPFLLSTSLHLSSVAQPILSATADRKEAALGETISVRFVLRGSNDVDGFVPPTFSGFTVIHGPDTRLEFLSEGRLKVPVATFAYLLRPDRTGVIEIGPASAGSAGWRVYSPPLPIRVSQTPTNAGMSSGPSDSGRQMEAVLKKGLFIRLETDKTDAYVGEPILVTYRLYTSLHSESQVMRRPAFAGFSVVEVERSDSSAPVEEVIDGQTFQSYVLRKVHLIPLREGRYDLEPVVVHNKVTLFDSDATSGESSLSRLLSKLYPDGRVRDPGRKTELTVQSPARSILVKPLPHGAPADFTGAVGRFRLSVTADGDTLQSGESGRLRLVMEGSGNLPLLSQPRIEWPSGMESFEPESSEETDPTRVPLSGRRIFVVPFSSRAIGRHVVKTASMSAFDPEKGAYYKLEAEPVTISVVPSIGSAVDEEQTSPVRPDLTGVPFPLLWIGIPLLVVIGAFAMSGRIRRKGRSRIAVDAKPIMEEFRLPSPHPSGMRLEAAGILLSQGRPSDCCRELELALAEAAEVRYNVSASAGEEAFTQGLVRNGVPTDRADEWVGLVRACQVEGFNPLAGSEVAGGLLERARRLLNGP